MSPHMCVFDMVKEEEEEEDKTCEEGLQLWYAKHIEPFH